MIKLHDKDGLREFADRDAVITHFELSGLTADDFAGMKAASDAGFPLHAAVDPCTLEIRGRRFLMLDNDAASLRAEYRMRQQDI